MNHRNNCSCNLCVARLENHEERITKLEQKKRKIACGGNKTPTPRIPAWFKMWNETEFKGFKTEINERISNIENQMVRKDDLKSSAFKRNK